MNNFIVPAREEVSEHNRSIFDELKKGLGFVPNIYAFLAINETALTDYLTYQRRQSTLSNKEKEVINLVASQINSCKYCQSAHTAISKMNGFTEEQIIEIRKLNITFDDKVKVLAEVTASLVKNRGKASQEALENFINAGYTQTNFIDVIMVISDITVSNYLHNAAGYTIDFPEAAELN